MCDTGRLVFLGIGAVAVVAGTVALLVTLRGIDAAVRSLP